MKKIGLILSLSWVAACAGAPFPKERLYIPDLQNKVCTEYEIVDVEEITFRRVRELELEAKGPCDRMAGFSRSGFKNVQNWIRDQIKEL